MVNFLSYSRGLISGGRVSFQGGVSAAGVSLQTFCSQQPSLGSSYADPGKSLSV